MKFHKYADADGVGHVELWLRLPGRPSLFERKLTRAFSGCFMQGCERCFTIFR